MFRGNIKIINNYELIVKQNSFSNFCETQSVSQTTIF